MTNLINFNAFNKNHPHGERNRKCIRNKELLSSIDKFLNKGTMTAEEYMELEHLFQSQRNVYIPLWLKIDMIKPDGMTFVFKSIEPVEEPDTTQEEPDTTSVELVDENVEEPVEETKKEKKTSKNTNKKK